MLRIKYQEAVGQKVKTGKPAIGDKPSKVELKKLYVKESRSMREVAEILGCSKDMVYRALKECGIERRKQYEKRSQLMNYDLSHLKREIRKKGNSQVARKLGIHKSTLTRYMKKLISQG